MFKQFKSSLGTKLLPSHCVAPPEELVPGGMPFNSSLILLMTYTSVRLPVHYVCLKLADAAMLLGNIGDQQRSSYLITCVRGVHFQYSRKYYKCERRKGKVG